MQDNIRLTTRAQEPADIKIRTIGNISLLIDAHGEPLAAENYYDVITRLVIAHEQLKVGKTPAAIIGAEYDRQAHIMIRDSILIRNPIRNQLIGVSHSVYFVSDKYDLNRIKIGYTARPINRLGTLRYVQPHREPVHLWAIAITPAARRLERALHSHFRTYRIEGEWYTAAPVLEYLNGVEL